MSLSADLSPVDLLHNLRKNYVSAGKILADLYGDNIPDDVQDLLDLINNDSDARKIFQYHASLVPIGIYSALYESMYDKIRFELPKAELVKILRFLPYSTTWITEIRTNELLMIPFNSQKLSYVVALDEPDEVFITKAQKKCLISLGIDARGQIELDHDQKHLIMAVRFLDYLRNRSSHRVQDLLQWRKGHPTKDSGTAEGSEWVSYVRFPRLLGYLQMQLYRLGKLSQIPLDDFF